MNTDNFPLGACGTCAHYIESAGICQKATKGMPTERTHTDFCDVLGADHHLEYQVSTTLVERQSAAAFAAEMLDEIPDGDGSTAGIQGLTGDVRNRSTDTHNGGSSTPP